MRPRGLTLTEVLEHYGVPLQYTQDDPCVTPRLLKPQKNGYWAVRWNGKADNLHRIILEWKLGERPPRHIQACHSCGNPSCVNPGHIRGDTALGNMKDQYTHGTRHFGFAHPRCRLSDDQVREIRLSDKSTKELATDFDVSIGYIQRLKRDLKLHPNAVA